MRLFLAHPEVPSCNDCCRWVYAPKTWTRSERGGQPVERPDGSAPPCWQCPKIPHGEPANPETGRQSELTPAGWKIYEHYLRCRAVSRFPADSLVERHAAIIRQVEDLAAQTRAMDPILAMANLLSRK